MESSYARKELGTVDYFALAGLLVTSTGIGLYFAFRDRKERSTDNYYFGGKNMHPIAVGLSLAVTFRSSVSVLALPSEAYISGSLVLWDLVMVVAAIPITTFYFISVIHRLQLSTIYEYLELRFSGALRRIAAGMLALGTIFYMGTVVYLPAAALNAITPLTLEWSILLTGFICTLYTTLGGMKGVIWTDVIQSVVMITGILTVFVRGIYVTGGFGEVLAAMERGGRMTALRFDFGLLSRLSPIALLFGRIATCVNDMSFSQAMVQRYQSCKTARHAKYALLVYTLPTILIVFTAYGNGFVMYAYFEGCDPVESGKVQSIDQGIAYMAMEIFEIIPGLAGLFIAAIFSATLSTVSSCLNSLSMVVLHDFIAAKWPSIPELRRVLIGKALVICFGGVVVGMAFAISSSDSRGLELFDAFLGLIYGPLAGIFVLGFFFPWTNTVGAYCGLFSGYAILAFMFVGKNFFNHPPYRSNVPGVTTDQCPFNISATVEPPNSTRSTTEYFPICTNLDHDNRTFLRDIYNVNFNLFMFIGFITAVVLGLAASFLSGHIPASEADPKLFIPLIDNNRFPKFVRRFFRFGVREIEQKAKKGTTAHAEDKYEENTML